MLKPERIHMRLTSEERQALDRLAAEKATTRTNVVAGLLLAAAQGQRATAVMVEPEKEDPRRREAIAV